MSMVAQDSDGQCLRWSKRKLVGQPRPVDGEALAVHMARLSGWSRVMIESDCSQVISSLSSSSTSFVFRGYLGFLSIFFSLYLLNMLAHRIASNNSIPCTDGHSFPMEIS